MSEYGDIGMYYWLKPAISEMILAICQEVASHYAFFWHQQTIWSDMLIIP